MSAIVLVIEDEIEIREELVRYFNVRGYRAYGATDGLHAFELVRARGLRPSVVLLDLVLPDMDGSELLDRQSEEPALAGVPVIVFTAQPDRLRHKTDSVLAVLEKPIDLPRMLRLVEEAVRART